MKIVHVEDYFDPTAGYQINELLSASRNFNDEVFLITSTNMEPFHKKLDLDKDREFEEKTGVKIIRLEAKLIVSSRAILKGLNKTIKQINPNVVFLHGIGDFKDLILYKRKQKYKIIRDCHMSWVASQNKFRKIYYKLFKIFFSGIINRTNKYDKVYALGEEEFEYLKKLGINDNKIDYLYHGYNDEIIYYDENERREIRNKYSVEEEDILISYIGKFDEQKKPHIIFEIVENINPVILENKRIKLLFIGSKNKDYAIKFNYIKERSKLECIIDEPKPFNELRKYFSASDICIFPKGCTLSAIHAQVCGSRVIMEDHKSNKERVINNNDLYEINNIKQAATILENIIKQDSNKVRINIKNSKIESREYKKQIKYFKKDLIFSEE